MKQGIIYAHSCAKDSLIIPRREILRYMNCRDESSEAGRLIDEYMPEALNALTPKGGFQYLPLEISEDMVCISDVCIQSANLSKNLSDCSACVVFALSCGTELDRLIFRYSRTRPSAALCINAIGTAAIEAYADKFCSEISRMLTGENLFTRPRFSPGYGDFSLDFQPHFLKLTNAGRTVGITLTDKLLMMPSKSVTAVMGVSKTDAKCLSGGCGECNKKECRYRR